MNRFRSPLALMVALCVVLLSLAGCSGKATTPKIDNTPVELTLLLWPGVSREAIDEVIYEYNKKRPNVRIRVTQSTNNARMFFGGGGSGSNLAAIMEGADLALLPRTQAVQLAQAGALRDLSAVRLPNLNDGVAHLFDDLSRRDGKRFGLPFDFTPAMMTINQQAFVNNGIKVPSTDWTVQEFEQALQGLKSAGQTVAITPASLLDPVIGAFGGKVYDPHTQRWMLDTDEAKQGLAYIARLTQAGLIPADSSGGGMAGFIVGGAQGGQGGRGGFNLPAISTLPGNINIRSIGGGGSSQILNQQVYPKGPHGRSVPVSAMVAVASSASANGEVAVDFIREMVGSEAMQIALAKGGIRPVIASSKALAAWQDVVGDKAAQLLELSLQGGHPESGVSYNEVLTALTPYFQGKVTLDQVLPDLLAKLN